MSKIIAVVLAIHVAVSSVPAYAADSSTPIADAIAREGARLALEAQATHATDNWSAVQHLRAGTSIVVTTTTDAISRRFVAADDRRIVLLNAEHPLVPRHASDRLIDLTATEPETVAAMLDSNATIRIGHVRLERAGLFIDNRKIADFDQVVQAVGASDVRQVRLAPHFRGSIAGAIGGAAGGFLLSIPIGVSLGLKQCGRSCSDELLLMNLSFVGLPIAGGILGARAFGGVRSEIIYQA